MNDHKSFAGSKNFLLAIIEGAPYGIIAIDPQGIITIANAQALLHLDLGVAVQDVLHTNILDVLGDMDELTKQIHKSLARGRTGFDLEEFYRKGKYLALRGRKMEEGMIITIADISSIKESEHMAMNALLEGQEQERKRLAREIHDGIGPILSTVKMNLSGIEDEIETLNHSLGEKFRKSYNMIDEAANDLRSISHNLMPKLLSDFGLVEALETHCEKINDTRGIAVDFIHSGKVGRLDMVTELALYRISQELINNTLKYAMAKKITLQLIKRDSNIQLMYEDDGQGFNHKKVHKGLGLMNIENRTKALAGEVVIDSQPGKGMTATIEIPSN